jgi:uncharacterized repeat protein (TIGR01451 family)
MVSPTKKLGWMVGTVFMGVFAVLMLLQFNRAMAASVQEAVNAKPADTPQRVNAVTPGIAGMVFVANGPLSSFSIVTSDGITYTDLLSRELGSEGGGRFDLVIAPDGKTAAITNFGDRTVYLIDVSNPIAPSVITSVTTPMFAEDMDFSPDGKYILVTDGGSSDDVVSIDVASATIVDIFTDTVEEYSVQAQAVEIAPDGTVILADYFDGSIHTLLLDALGQLTYANSYTITYPIIEGADPYDAHAHPVNVGIAPDGQTVIVCDATTSTVPVYQIIAPGVLTLTDIITGLHGSFPEGKLTHASAGSQSVAFNGNGDKAYVHVNNFMYGFGDIKTDYYTGTLAVLNVSGPGQVSLDVGGLLTIPRSTTSQLYGVDSMAVMENKLYISCPTVYGCSKKDGTTSLYVVDLADYSLSETLLIPRKYDRRKTLTPSIPTGIAALPVRLEINKTVSSPSAKPGDAITFTISFTNVGVVSATQGLLTDDLGDFITHASFTSSGVALTQEPGSKYIWHLPDLGHNAGGTITITGILAKPLAAGAFTNTATLMASWVTKTASVALEIEQVAPEANAGPDQTVKPFTAVTLSGSGSDANGDALTAYQWKQTGGNAVILSGINTTHPSFTAPANVGTLTFTLVVTDAYGMASVPDKVLVNVIPFQANIAIQKVASHKFSELGYVITVTNLGPDHVAGVIISDTFNAAITDVVWQCQATGGASCVNGVLPQTANGSGNIHESVNLPSGGVVVYTVTAHLPFGQRVLNVAEVILPANVADPNLENNIVRVYNFYQNFLALIFVNTGP